MIDNLNDTDWDRLSVVYSKDLYDYMERPLSTKKLRNRIGLMLTINNIYNTHTLNTKKGLIQFWKDSLVRDRKIMNDLRELYVKGKE